MSARDALGRQWMRVDDITPRSDHGDPRTFLGNDDTYHEQVAGEQAHDPHEVYKAMRADIAQRGIVDPLHVDEKGNLVNGYHRLAIARELGHTHVPVEHY